MSKIVDFFKKKETHQCDFGGTYESTKFKEWYYNSWFFDVECLFTRLKDFSFKYDFIYKYVYLKLQKTIAVEYDAWNLNDNMVDYLIPRIMWLVNHKHGVSSDFLNSSDNLDGCYETQQNELFELAKCLANYRLLEKQFNNYIDNPDNLKKYDEKINQGFDLLKKNKYNLWD